MVRHCSPARPCPQGPRFPRLGGRLVSTRALKDLLARAASGDDHPYVDTIAVGEDLHLVLPPGTPNGRGNHSCDPNLWWVDAYTLAARRDIAADEEVTNDYATSTDQEAFTMDCSCSAPLCRRTVSGRDWRREELRQRYGYHWVPILLSRIEATEGSGRDWSAP
jgi:uncharacterized protein